MGLDAFLRGGKDPCFKITRKYQYKIQHILAGTHLRGAHMFFVSESNCND